MPRAIARAAMLTKAAMRAPPGARIAAYVFCAAATKPVDAETNSVYKYTPMKKQYDFSKARRGPVVPPTPGKTRITIRLDNDVIEHFQATVDRAGGGNYQTLINDALREYIRGARLEAVVRKAVRDEVKTARQAFIKTA
jgi:uncharacterized protein (DUF4415 family)